MQEFAREYTPALVEHIHHHTGDRPLFDMYTVEDEIEKALARRVDLKSGGYLIVDQTEAMTTIDVNTGGYVGARNFDDTIFKTNLEAAQAIARQLRLRNLGGIIALVFRCKITGGHLTANDEVTAFHWADEQEIRQLTSEAYAVRLLDALREGMQPAVRQHDGTDLLS